MPISDAELNAQLDDYFRRLATAYPHCPLASLSEPQGNNPHTDSRLAALVELGQGHGALLRYCEPKHVQALTWRCAGVAYDPGRGWGSDNPQTRPLTAKECATAMGLTRSQWRRLITDARGRVRQAMNEQVNVMSARRAA